MEYSKPIIKKVIEIQGGPAWGCKPCRGSGNHSSM